MKLADTGFAIKLAKVIDQIMLELFWMFSKEYTLDPVLILIANLAQALHPLHIQ